MSSTLLLSGIDLSFYMVVARNRSRYDLPSDVKEGSLIGFYAGVASCPTTLAPPTFFGSRLHYLEVIKEMLLPMITRTYIYIYTYICRRIYTYM